MRSPPFLEGGGWKIFKKFQEEIRKVGGKENKMHLFYKRIWLKIKKLFINLRGGDLKINQFFHQSQRRERLKGKKKRLFINKKRKIGGYINVNNLEIKYFLKQIIQP